MLEEGKSSDIPYSVREQHFCVKHHDTVGPFVDIMLGVFTTCQWQKAGSHVDLEEAHKHVFGDKEGGVERCAWCYPTFERRRDYQKEFFS